MSIRTLRPSAYASHECGANKQEQNKMKIKNSFSLRIRDASNWVTGLPTRQKGRRKVQSYYMPSISQDPLSSQCDYTTWFYNLSLSLCLCLSSLSVCLSLSLSLLCLSVCLSLSLVSLPSHHSSLSVYLSNPLSLFFCLLSSVQTVLLQGICHHTQRL